MKKKITKKLKLDADTVKLLGELALAQVAGGGGGPTKSLCAGLLGCA